MYSTDGWCIEPMSGGTCLDRMVLNNMSAQVGDFIVRCGNTAQELEPSQQETKQSILGDTRDTV